ncbi:MAG TPA: basic amino acid ABC transporter substrate-binding protein [Bellilinea sp.]|nr:basic amino acid ABC transporter substrate-binding protein [Bellilinea sp.]
MKRNLFFVLGVFILLALMAAGCSSNSASDVVSIASDATYPPFESVDDKTKEIVGFDIDLINAIADKADMKIEIVNVPFDSVLAGLQTCQYDLGLSSITITEERKQNFLFSDPYINAGQIITVQAANTDITTTADLTGKRLAAQLGTTGEIEAKKFSPDLYKPYDSVDLAFLDLQNGQIDAVITDYPTSANFVSKSGAALKMVGEPFTSESYGIAICKTKPELQTKINAALKTLIDDGTVESLTKKWLAVE